jgi:hypothetical protein
MEVQGPVGLDFHDCGDILYLATLPYNLAQSLSNNHFENPEHKPISLHIMAPIPHSIFPRAIRHYHSSGGSYGGGGGGGIGGGVVAAIIALMPSSLPVSTSANIIKVHCLPLYFFPYLSTLKIPSQAHPHPNRRSNRPWQNFQESHPHRTYTRTYQLVMC